MDNPGVCIEPYPRTSPLASTESTTTSPPPVTTSTSCTDTINGSHEFRITGYTLSKGLGIGRYIASETFHVGGYAWAIYFYPDGKSPEDNATYVSVFIALASDGTDVRALFELTLMDQSGNGNHKVHSHFGRTLESGPYTLKYRGSMWGYKRFFKRVPLESSGYLKDDCLIIRGVVGVVKSHTDGPKIYNIPIPPSDMGLQFGKLLETKKGTDVSFEVDEEVFCAHKLVLAARSPVFKAQLFGPMKEKSMQCIKVEDMESPVFKEETPRGSSHQSSGMISFELSNGVPFGPHVPTSIDDDQYVEYPLDYSPDFPCDEEDEERMIMIAMMESLKDFGVSQPPKEDTLLCNGSNSSESSNKSVTPAPSTEKSCNSAPSTDATSSLAVDMDKSASKGTLLKELGNRVDPVDDANAAAAPGKAAKPSDLESADGTKATLTVEKSPSGHNIIEGLFRRWDRNFFKSNR